MHPLSLPSVSLLAFLLSSLLLASLSSAEAEPLPPAVDTEAFLDQLSVLTDGQGHYVTLLSFEHKSKEGSLGDHLFSGDGAHLYRTPVHGRFSDSGKKRLSLSFWAPRAHKSKSGELTLADGQYTVRCGERKTPLSLVTGEARSALLSKAKFFERRWRRHAYLLARDDEGTYYYVDRARKPADNYDFHLYVGQRGNMKALPLSNIVSDSEGDIFASKRGRLRQVNPKHSTQRAETLEWIKGKKRKALTKVPVGMNAQLIYRDLGVYDGERLGVPCDDL